jgi:periplasmic protein TonB
MSATAEIREPEVPISTLPLPIDRRPPPFSIELAKPLFGDSLLELHELKRERRIWTTFTSLVLQCGLIGVLILIPLWFTDALPTAQLVTFLVAPPPPPPPPPPATESIARVVKQVQSDLMSSGQLRTPTRVPARVAMIREEDAPPPLAVESGGVVGGVPGGIPGGSVGGVIGGIISATSNISAAPKLALPAPPKRIRISQGVTTGLLVRKVEPFYPDIAKNAHVQGQVILKAIINKEGHIQDLQLISGHVLLAPAALNAVKQWLYKPFLLNGDPVEVETTVTVTFQLQST